MEQLLGNLKFPKILEKIHTFMPIFKRKELDALIVNKMLYYYILSEMVPERALVFALRYNYTYIFNLLVRMNIPNWEWMMCEAAYRGRLDLVKLAIEKGASNYTKAARYAIQNKQIEIVEYLTNIGAYNYGLLTLEAARHGLVIKGCKEHYIASICLGAIQGAQKDIFLKYWDRQSWVLEEGIEEGYYEIPRLVIPELADCTDEKIFDKYPTSLWKSLQLNKSCTRWYGSIIDMGKRAIRENNLEMLLRILKNDKGKRITEPCSLLSSAIRKESQEMVDLILREIDTPTSEDLLREAISQGDIRYLENLPEAEINNPVLLSRAASCGYLNIVKLIYPKVVKTSDLHYAMFAAAYSKGHKNIIEWMFEENIQPSERIVNNTILYSDDYPSEKMEFYIYELFRDKGS